LAEGDTFLLYTDGITEAMNPNQELFSEKRLVTLFTSGEHESSEELVHGLISAVKEYEAGSEQADDITVMAIQYFGAAQHPMNASLELIIHNQISEIGEANQRFAAFAKEQQLSSQIVVALQIVFEELLSNIIKYNFSDDAPHDIEIKVEVAADQITAAIIDDGIAFNPFDAPVPDTTLALEEREIGGLGVHLVRSMMDKVLYERAGNKNVVTVSKYRDMAEG
jgi:sigma-B regulation protein RsbU (phosphoserine phosphatase)